MQTSFVHAHPCRHTHRIVVLDEEKGDDGDALPSLRLIQQKIFPTPTQQALLDQTLAKFTDVVCDSPGRTDLLQLHINTSDNGPIRSPPYHVTPALKEEVKTEIDKLALFTPPDSPWSSSIITVRKKEGGVRICIDFRTINKVT